MVKKSVFHTRRTHHARRARRYGITEQTVYK